MNKESKVAVQGKKRYRKNEIVSICTRCKCERVLAYWDTELEHYIYLSDEPVLCAACQVETLSCISQGAILGEKQILTEH